VSPNFRRYLPFILILFVLLIAAQTLFKKHSSSGSTAGTTASQTIDAANLIDLGEQAYMTANGRFTSHLADLIPLHPRLATDLAMGLTVQLDVSTDGHKFLAQVGSSVLSIVRSFDDTKVAAQSCFIVKSGSGVSCPAPVR
jgi:hypothetical protein